MPNTHPPTVSALVERLRRIAGPLVRDVFASAGGTADAERELRAWLATDTVLRDALAAEGLNRFVRDAVAWCAARRPDAPYQVAAASRLLDFRLAGGLTLERARRADVLAESRVRFDQAKSHLALAKWLKAIAHALPDDDVTVGTVLTERQLMDLQRLSREFGRGQAPIGEKFGDASRSLIYQNVPENAGVSPRGKNP